MADGAGNEMDSLFEGMDFMMPGSLEDVSESPADGTNGDLTNVSVEKSGLKEPVSISTTAESVVPSAPTPVRSSSSSSLSSVPSLSRNVSGSLASAAPFSPSAHGGLLRDPSRPLDESLFSGLDVSPMDDEGSMQMHFEVSESHSTSTGDAVAQKPAGFVQHQKSGSFDGKSAGERVGNGEKDKPTVESIMTAYNNVGPTTSFKHSSAGNLQSGKSLTLLASSPSQKPGMRRKKRSMKIGYGREEEEQEELSTRKGAARNKIIGAVAGKDSVNGNLESPRQSFSSQGLSRTSSQGQFDGEELSESTSHAGESEASFREVAVADIADGVESYASKTLETHTSLPEITPTSSTSGNIDKEKLDVRDKDPLDTRRSEDMQQVGQVEERRLSGGNDQDSPGNFTPLSYSAGGEESVEEESTFNRPPGEIVRELNADKETTDLAVDSEFTGGQGNEGGESEEVDDLIEDELDIRSRAAKWTGTIEEKLQYVKDLVAHQMQELQGRSSALSSLRKAAIQARRQAAEKVSAASTRCKTLEEELDAACEREDFEKADVLSESVAEAENAMKQAAEDFKLAEVQCDLAGTKVQKVLDLQLAAEEEGARLFELLKQEAEDAAERVRKEVQEVATREMERLSADEEAAEGRKRKLALSLRIIEEANAELDKVIGEGTKAETELKASLTEQRSHLVSELEDLLSLVRKKEAEIAECDERIATVDEKMSSVVSNFEMQRKSLDSETETLALTSVEVENDFKRISAEKDGLLLLLADAEKGGLQLEAVAMSASTAGCALQEVLKLKKAIAVTTSFYKEKRTELLEKEKKAEEEAQALREESSSGRSSLQELTSLKVKLNQEIAEKKQLILFAEKRAPELDSEKKLAAAARNFKEAGRLAAEAKALTSEKEAATADMNRLSSELQNLESETEHRLSSLGDMDNLIAEKEKEAAVARCERLRLMAAASRMERDTAIELEDFEEAESLDSEAEAADSQAEELQRLHQLQGGRYERQSSSLVSSLNSEDAIFKADCKDTKMGLDSDLEQTDKLEEVDGVELETGGAL